MTTKIHCLNDYQKLLSQLRTTNLKDYEIALMEGLSAFSVHEMPMLTKKLEDSNLPLSLLSEFSLRLKKRVKELHAENLHEFIFFGSTDIDAISYFVSACFEKVMALFRGVMDVCYICQSRLPSKISSLNFINRYLMFCFLDIMEAKYKFHTNYLVSSLLPYTELPTSDLYEGEIPGVVVGGWIRRFFSSSNIAHLTKVRLALALQNCKRAALSISRKKQIDAIIEHQNSMLGKDYPFEDEPDELIEVKSKLDHLVKYYYLGMSDKEIPIWRLPSLSACFESSSANLGAYGYFYDTFAKPGTSYKAGTLSIDTEERNYFEDLLNNSDLFEPRCKMNVSSYNFDLKETIASVQSSVLLSDVCQATYCQVLEPFKVRGLTKGNAFPYQMGRQIQKPLHARIRDGESVFRFVGMRHNVEDINKVYSGSELFSMDVWGQMSVENRKLLFTHIVAGDFTKATDNMHPSLPKRFIDSFAIYSNVSPIWIKVLRLTLGQHEIFYPELEEWEKMLVEGDYETFLVQKFGQLMGSPTSFPVLCLVNAAMLWASCEEYMDECLSWDWVVSVFRPLINGDDISFLTNPDHYAIWKRYCKASGLSLSPGKNYLSTDFVNINSTTYWCTESDNFGYYKKLKVFEQLYVPNPGLLKGQAKVLADDSSNPFKAYRSLMPICDQLDELLFCAKNAEKERTNELFFNYLNKELKGSHRNFFLPRLFGGLGLSSDKPVDNISESQMAVALLQLENYKDLSDIPLKYQFNEDATQQMELCLEETFLRYFYDIQLNLERPNIRGPGCAIYDIRNALPDLSIFSMNDKLSVNIFKKDKKGRITKKRKEPESRFLEQKKKALKKAKYLPKLDYSQQWLLENVFRQCNLQPTTCDHVIDVTL